MNGGLCECTTTTTTTFYSLQLFPILLHCTTNESDFFLFFLLPAKGSRRVEDTQQIIQEVQPCKPARRQSADLLIHFYRTEIKAHTAEQMRAERQRHTGRERRRREMELIYNSFMIFLLRKKNFQAQPPEAALECLFVFERSSTRAQTLWSDQTPKCQSGGGAMWLHRQQVE